MDSFSPNLFLTVFFFLLFFLFSPPTLKTATPSSRTHLKQQLMREQLLQEQERRQAHEKALKLQEQHKPVAAPVMRVPIQNLPLEVPPQVLQVMKF